MTDYARFEQLTVAVDDGIATVTIPVVGSSGRRQSAVHREVSEIWPVLGADPAVRVVVVTGTDGDFYVSADAGGLQRIPTFTAHQTFDVMQRIGREGYAIVYEMVNLDKPIISAINGRAAGGGLAVALLADISIAAEDAELIDPHVALGIAAGDHATMIWPLLCGMAKSKRYLLTSEPLSGREAERIGVVSLAVPGNRLAETAQGYARKLADGPQHAIRFTKRALNQWLRLGGIVSFDYSFVLEQLNFFGPELDEAIDRALPRSG